MTCCCRWGTSDAPVHQLKSDLPLATWSEAALLRHQLQVHAKVNLTQIIGKGDSSQAHDRVRLAA